MNILKQAMHVAGRSDIGNTLPVRLAEVLDMLAAARNLDPSAKQDIVAIMEDSLELAAAMLDQTYPAELVLRRVTGILSTAQRILQHTETCRPGRQAFGAMLENGTLLPVVAQTPDEAEIQLRGLKAFGVPASAIVIPIKINSTYIMQPQRLELVKGPINPVNSGQVETPVEQPAQTPPPVPQQIVQPPAPPPVIAKPSGWPAAQAPSSVPVTPPAEEPK